MFTCVTSQTHETSRRAPPLTQALMIEHVECVSRRERERDGWSHASGPSRNVSDHRSWHTLLLISPDLNVCVCLSWGHENLSLCQNLQCPIWRDCCITYSCVCVCVCKSLSFSFIPSALLVVFIGIISGVVCWLENGDVKCTCGHHSI